MRLGGLIFGVVLFAAACDKQAPPPPVETKAAETAAPAPSASAAPAVGPELTVKSGKATFLIDAPLEKIKGETSDADGKIGFDPANLTKATGTVRFKVSTLSTTTFGTDKSKNDAQTEHARAWMEVGPDSPAATKADFEWAKFTLKSVEATPAKLADAPEKDGARTVQIKATGDFRLHGIEAPKTLSLTATFAGPADAPTSVTLKTTAPFAVSMKQHGVMPRDKVGSFLNGALEKVGKKIDDQIQVSLEATAAK